MAARTRARISRFSASAARTADRMADVRAAAISLDDRGRASFRMIAAGGGADVHLRLHGGHHVSNALAAAAIAAELGLDVPAIADALSHATARSKKRMELHERADGVLVVNDAYNANPDSTRAAIEALRHLTSTGRRGFAVLGYMAELGDFAEESHQEAAGWPPWPGWPAWSRSASWPRRCSTGRAASPAGGARRSRCRTRTAAVEALRNRLRPGDVVLVKASKSAGLWEVADGLLAEVDE